MVTEIMIPKLGMTMREGTIVEWVVPDGAVVEPEQVVFILSTDKLDTDVAAQGGGTLRHGAPAGTEHPVGAVVGWVVGDGDLDPSAASCGGDRQVASPYARRLARERGVDLSHVTGSGPGGRIVAADVPAAQMTSEQPTPHHHADDPDALGSADRLLATPVARRLAETNGVDLHSVRGTGPGGRITKADVADRAASRVIPLRGMRKAIADRMHASLHDMAQLTLGMEVDMTEAAVLREKLRAEIKLSYTDLVARAVVKGLGDHSELNASIEGGAIYVHDAVHLGVAVAVPDGLLVPVVREAQRADLRALSEEVTRLAAACRDGSVTLDELDGSTFTISALGASGVDFFTPVINPPNVAILGIGRVRDGVGWEDGRPVQRQLMTLSLTIDHRAVDGVPGAAFLADVRDRLQAPYRLFL